MVGIGVPELLVLVVLFGLIAAAIGTRLARRHGGRESRPQQPLFGPTAVTQFFAGCGLAALILVGLLGIGLGVPAWQKLEARGHVGPAEYLTLGCVAAAYV